MSIWSDIGEFISDAQAFKDGFFQEIASEADAVSSTVSDAAQDIKDSAATATDTIKEVVQIPETVQAPESTGDNNS